MSIKSGLKAYWKMDTAGDNPQPDSVGNNDLVNVGSTSAAGILGNSRSMNVGSFDGDHLLVADHPDLSRGASDWTINLWVYMTSISSMLGIAGKSSLLGVTPDYQLLYSDTWEKFRFDVSSPLGTQAVYAVSFGSPAVSTWYMLTGLIDNANDKIKIGVNGGNIDEKTFDAGTYDSPWDFIVGQYLTEQMRGRVDEIGLWNRILTQAELDYLYNSGAGRTWPFDDDAGGAGLVIFSELCAA